MVGKRYVTFEGWILSDFLLNISQKTSDTRDKCMRWPRYGIVKYILYDSKKEQEKTTTLITRPELTITAYAKKEKRMLSLWWNSLKCGHCILFLVFNKASSCFLSSFLQEWGQTEVHHRLVKTRAVTCFTDFRCQMKGTCNDHSRILLEGTKLADFLLVKG